MAKIPEIKLLIEKEIEEKLIKGDFREHLGASVLGDECSRRIWYGFRWSRVNYITPTLQRLFNRGHAEEIVVIEDLINAGCKVKGINIDESIMDRFKTVFKHDLPVNKQEQKTFLYGFGGASKDGTIYNLPDAPKTPHLLEVKTANTKNFEKTKRLGIRRAKLQHFVQCQIYMKLFKLKRCLYIMVCKDDDRRHYERVKYEAKVAKEYEERGNNIIKSELPPARVSDDKNNWPCSYCDYSPVCYLHEPPARNCRTCKNILFESNGVNADIKCGLNRKKLKYKKQLKGCKKYKVDPAYG